MFPDFEEKTFETAANGELRLASTDVYAPGQVAEGILGIDVATFQPSTAAVWTYIHAAAPCGIRLTPNLWAAGTQGALDVELPSYVVSLLLQYKRSNYFDRSNAKQYPHWRRPFFRFALDRDQQKTLEKLEQAVSSHAVVRYAAPTFHRFSKFEALLRNSAVLQNTNFVSPSLLTNHDAWTYVEPGASGWANPAATAVPTESWQEVLRTLAARRQKATVLEHLRFLAQSLINAHVVPDATVPTQPSPPLDALNDPTRLRGFLDLLVVGHATGRVAANWWMEVQPITQEQAQEATNV